MLNDVIAVTNRKLSQRPFLEQIKRVCQLRPGAIILREKDLSETEYAKLAEEVYNITTGYDVRLIIHTHINVARELGINTVHMSLHNMREYRKEFIVNVNKINNTNKIDNAINANVNSINSVNSINITADINSNVDITIGCSIHSVEEAVEARNMGSSYITAGHVYVTDCKKGLAPRGLDFLKNVCDSVDIPVYAIGGINIDGGRREEVKKYGAAGSCIMSGMMKV